MKARTAGSIRVLRPVTVVATLLAAALFIANLTAWATLGADNGVWFSQIALLTACLASIAFTTLLVLQQSAPAPFQAAWGWMLAALILLGLCRVVVAFSVVEALDLTAGITLALSITEALAALIILRVLAIRASVGGFGWRRFTRLALDVTILNVAIINALMWYGTGGFDSFTGSAARGAFLQGFLASICLVAAVSSLAMWVTRRRVLRGWEMVFGSGILFLTMGLGVSQVATFLISAGGAYRTMWMSSAAVSLLGYLLIALGVLNRWLMPSWQAPFAAPAPTERSVWPSIVVSTAVFVIVGWLAVSVTLVPDDSPQQAIQFACLTLVAFCMVARTIVAMSEMRLLREFSTTDPVTGANDVRQMNERIQELMTGTRRYGDSFMLAVLAIDPSSAVPQAGVTGARSSEDDVLRSVATTLIQGCCGDEALYRLSGNEFVILMRTDSEKAAQGTASRILTTANRAAAGHAGGMEASLGYALCPFDAVDPDTLIAHAYGAQSWAKYLGRERPVRYNSATMRVLGDEQRLGVSMGKTQMDIVHALSAATDARHPANYGHSRNVATLAVLLAESIGMTAEHCSRIRIAAILHDVGKLALPDAVLDSEGVSVRDGRRVQEHCLLGSQLVESIALPGVGEWIKSHHERWDGKGYPDGLAGDEIPLEARIIALADAYDAMTAGNRSGAGMSKAAALQEIDFGLGSRFDPEIGETFIVVAGTAGLLGWSDEWSAA